MIISIRSNAMSAYAARQMNTHYAGLSRSVERLSSGLRLNRSADDAAGLSRRQQGFESPWGRQ
ncbi:MAG: hypothetical protein LBD42_00430 [Desulfovibrio sp.]|nr:hypothetical protein [Desulfovibrio sp.]